MDDLLKKSLEMYAGFNADLANPTRRVGRPESSAAAEADIWRDIWAKLDPRAGQEILDIGCGSGVLARNWCEAAAAGGFDLVLLDIPEAIERLKAELPASLLTSNRIRAVSGAFPFGIPKAELDRRYDAVLVYSVIHYSKKSAEIVDAAAALLKPGGTLFVGDVPNLSKKGRFLATKTGRAFEAAYQGVDEASLPVYADHRDFIRRNSEASYAHLTDEFLVGMVESYRNRGYDAYLLPQPTTLPFFHTREDLMIRRSAE